MERRIFEGGGVAGQLRQRVIEIAALLLVLEGEKTLLPHVRPAVTAAGLFRAIFVGEPSVVGICFAWCRVTHKSTQVFKKRLGVAALVAAGFPFIDEVSRRHPFTAPGSWVDGNGFSLLTCRCGCRILISTARFDRSITYVSVGTPPGNSCQQFQAINVNQTPSN